MYFEPYYRRSYRRRTHYSNPYRYRRFRYGGRALTSYSGGRRRRYYKRRTARRRQRTQVPRSLAMRTTSQVKAYMPQVSEEGRIYIDSVTNPFGNVAQEKQILAAYHGAKIPDNSSYPTVAMTYHATGHFIGANYANADTGWISIHPLRLHNARGVTIGYSTGGLNPTGVVSVDWQEHNATQNLFGRYRIVSIGLKVQFDSPPADTEGHLWAGNSDSYRRLGAAWSPYTEIDRTLVDSKIPVRKGCTVRWIPRGEEDITWWDFTAAAPAQPYEELNHWLPIIRFYGVGANTDLLINAVIHVEALVDRGACSIPAQMSPVDLNWNLIYALASNVMLAPEVTTGDSFKSFFTKSGRFIRSVLDWIRTNAPKVAQYAVAAGQAAELLAV